MDLLLVILIVSILIVGISPAKIKFEGEYLIFSIPLLFIKKIKKKEELDSYRITMSAFPIILRFRDGTVYRWTSFPQWRSAETKSTLDEIIRQNKT